MSSQKVRRSRGKRRRKSAVSLLLLVSLVACSDRVERAPALDLLDEVAFADGQHETAMLDFGTSAANEALLSGWSWNETSGEGTTFVWSQGDASEVEVFVTRPRVLDVVIRTLAYDFGDAGPQTLAFSVNGLPVTTVEVPAGWSEISLEVPGEALVAGRNRFVFDYGRVASGLGRKGSRRLAVAFDWLRTGLEAGGTSGESRGPRRDGDAVVLPIPSTLDFYLDLPPGAALGVEGVEVGDGSSGDLLIELDSDAGGATQIAEIGGEQGPGEWLLTEEGGIYRLRFGGVASGDSSSGEIRILEPRILVPLRALPSADIETTGGGAAPATGAIAGERLDPPVVVLYAIDTLRADRMSVYGYENGSLPAFEAFADDAIVYDDVVAQSPWTLPSMASVFTGLPPLEHGVVSREQRIASDLTTLAEMMKEQGFDTAGFSANGYVSADLGFGQGFDHFASFYYLTTTAENLQNEALAWLDEHGREKPAFLFLHVIDPHDPYRPPPPYHPAPEKATGDETLGSTESLKMLKESGRDPGPETRALMSALYDGEVSYTDHSFGQFVEALRRRGLYDESLFVVLSDHGEELFEHGSWTHGHSMHAELLDVPLMIKLPGGELGGARVSDSVQHIDLMPTIATVLGIELPDEERTVDLVQLARRTDVPRRPRARFSYLDTRLASVVLGDSKLMVVQSRGYLRRPRLYDRGRDPRELDDLADERPVLTGFLLSLIERDLAGQRLRSAPEKAELAAETVEQLRALGYLE